MTPAYRFRPQAPTDDAHEAELPPVTRTIRRNLPRWGPGRLDPRAKPVGGMVRWGMVRTYPIGATPTNVFGSRPYTYPYGCPSVDLGVVRENGRACLKWHPTSGNAWSHRRWGIAQ